MNKQKMKTTKGGHCWSLTAFGKARFLGQKSDLQMGHKDISLLMTLVSSLPILQRLNKYLLPTESICIKLQQYNLGMEWVHLL